MSDLRMSANKNNERQVFGERASRWEPRYVHPLRRPHAHESAPEQSAGRAKQRCDVFSFAEVMHARRKVSPTLS